MRIQPYPSGCRVRIEDEDKSEVGMGMLMIFYRLGHILWNCLQEVPTGIIRFTPVCSQPAQGREEVSYVLLIFTS